MIAHPGPGPGILPRVPPPAPPRPAPPSPQPPPPLSGRPPPALAPPAPSGAPCPLSRTPTSTRVPPPASARATVRGEVREVLAALTDPELIASWAPVGFELEDPDGCPLHAGSHERVCGSLAGVKAFFDVDVTCAEPGRLELVADGPLAMD